MYNDVDTLCGLKTTVKIREQETEGKEEDGRKVTSKEDVKSSQITNN
jgi:hypothetical protein